MRIHYYNESQQMLNRNTTAFGIAAIGLFYILIFCPLWFIAYAITSRVVAKNAEGIYQVLAIAMVSYVLYCLIFLVKGMVLFYKGKGNWIWLPLFIVCTGFTCLPPAIIVYNLIHKSMPVLVSIGIAAIPAVVVYLHYRFHQDSAPFLSRFAYHLGITLACKGYAVGKKRQ